MSNKLTVAHELGHAVCAEALDGFWYPSSLSFEKDDNAIAYCYCDQLDTKKPHIKGPYSRTKQVMVLGGIFGEILIGGKWSPWSARADLDDLTTANIKSTHPLIDEVDNWMWRDYDSLSFRACTSLDTDRARRSFLLDSHDTARRLPELWKVYLEFCDKIDKIAFEDNVHDISKSGSKSIEGKELSEILMGIIHE